MKTSYQDIKAYTTRDGSQIRELMHPSTGLSKNQSLAEAIVEPGDTTLLHRHHKTEELYHITAGSGLMTLGSKEVEVNVGDTVTIPPGTKHRIKNTGNTALHILCACSPAYSHEDTELL